MAKRKKALPADLDALELAQLLGLTRFAIGVVMCLAPRRFTRLWLGDRDDTGTMKVIMRGFGSREIILGLGVLRAVESGDRVRGWVEAGVAADVADTAIVLVTRDVSFGRRLLTLAATAIGITGGLIALDALDD